MAHWVVLSPQTDTSLLLHHKTTDTDRASASCSVPVYSFTFAGTHCVHPQRDGQAELTRVAGNITGWFTHPQTVTHPSTNPTAHDRA